MCKYVVFAGVNGAGKTTFYLLFTEMRDMPRVNVDEIVREFGRWDNVSDTITAGKIAVRRVKQYFNERKSFNQETTLCGQSIVRNIKTAKQLGYYVELYYVGLDSEDLAVERVKNRVAKGGHGVPEADIKKRYKKSLAQLKNVLPYCDKVTLYDNSNTFIHIATYENNKWDLTDIPIPEWCKDIIENNSKLIRFNVKAFL